MSQHPSHASHMSHAAKPSHQAQQQALSAKEQTTLQVPVGHVSHKDIAKRAFAMFEARGSTHGHDVQDWLSASNALVAERQLSES
jgi:hypothetical protein